MMDDVVRAQLLDLDESIKNSPKNYALYNKRGYLKHI